MSESSLGFIHRFIPATKPGLPPLLLLHGTGGDENDLIPLGEALLPGAALLSPRGKVLEQGMPRFFHRLAMGVFDEADLKARTIELSKFITDACATYSLAAPVAVGLSNGANIAASLLWTHPQTLAGAVLLRAMLPYEPEKLPDLRSKPVLLLSGAADPIMPKASRDRLAALLRQSGATLTDQSLPAGHGLVQSDVTITATWLQQTRWSDLK